MNRQDFDDEVRLLPYDEENTPFGIDIDIDENEENVIVNDIMSYMDFCDEARDAENWVEMWDSDDDQYEGKVVPTDFPFENCSNLHIHVTAEKKDVFQVKAEQQIFTKPFVMLKPKPGAKGDIVDALEKKEVWLNWKLYDEIDIETSLDPVIHDAALKGTGIAKINWDTLIEPATKCERYLPEEIDKFENRFYNQRDSEAYKEAYTKLENGEPCKVYVSRLEVIWDKPMVHWVPLKNIHIHPSIPLRQHRALSEEKEVTWQELLNKVASEDYDKKVIDDIEEEYGKGRAEQEEITGITPEYKKNLHTIVESRYLYNYDGRGEKKCLVTILKERKRILKIKTYPYEHNLIDYLLYTIQRKAGSNFGYGIAAKLRHLNKALNELWNTTINAGYWSNAPTFKALENPSNPDPRIKKWGPSYVWFVKDMKSVEQFPINRNPVDMYKFIELLLREGDLHTGINDMSSGRESPMDPNAPAQKTAMLLQEMNQRIARAIKQLHKKNEELSEIVDKLYQQYYKFQNTDVVNEDGTPYEPAKESFEYEGKEWNITENDLFTECRYVANLSPLSVNKSLQHQINEQIIAYTAKVFQPIFQKNWKKFAEIYFKGAPGEWVNYVEDFLKEQEKPAPQGAEGQPPAEGQIPAEGAPGMAEDIPREALSEEVQGMVE